MIPIEEPVRILLLAANPSDTETLRLGQEARSIKDALEKRTKISFDLQRCEAVRSKDLRFEVLSYKPNFVHFSGHGEGEAGLVLENEDGATHLVTTEALESFFEIFKKHIRCVFLNCCYSQPQAEAIAQHIPFVIGTREKITDKAAIEFSIAFYEAIGQKEDIPRAFQYGIAALKLANLFSEARIPILFPEVLTTRVRSTKLKHLLTTKEEKILRGWILEDHCPLVLLRCPESATTRVKGPSAVGAEAFRSSPLAAQIAVELRLRQSFECTVSARLDSAPPITQTLSQLLSTLSTGTRHLEVIESPEEQMFKLVNHLQKRRCLVLLEGIDALFDEETSWYLPSRAEYGKFFEQILSARHQSCILATISRDIPGISHPGSEDQVRLMDLRRAKEQGEGAEAEEERDDYPQYVLDLRGRYPNRSSLYSHVRKCSQSTLFRTSERLPRHQPEGPARGARLAPVARPESAPAVHSFLEGPRPLLAIIGESGSGKTVLSHQIATELPLVLYYDTHHLEAAGSLTATLARDLGVHEQEIERLFQHIAWLLTPTEHFVIVVDAINEAIRIDPLALKAEIESISSFFPKSFKLIYTCRKVYWESHIQAQSPLPSEIYYDASVFVLGDFSDGEAREAFRRYQAVFHFSGDYDNLNVELRKKVANPLMLRMLAEGYQGSELPSFAPAVQVFHRYYKTLQERLSGILLNFLTLLVQRKAASTPAWEPESDQFRSLIVRTDPELATLSQQQLSSGTRRRDPLLILEDEGILDAVDQAKQHYRFTYDRFYEYLLGMEVGRKIDPSSPAQFSHSLVGLLRDLQGKHFSFIQALKSEIVRQTIIKSSPIWSLSHPQTLVSLLGSSDSQPVIFTKEVLRELFFESSSDVLGSLRMAFSQEASWLPIALDVVGDSRHHLPPLAVKGLFYGDASTARRSAHALISLLQDSDNREHIEHLIVGHLLACPNVTEAEVSGLFYYSAALAAQSEYISSDCLQEISRFWKKVLVLERYNTREGLTTLKVQFFRLTEQEGPNFFPSETNLTGFEYLWSVMPPDVRAQAAVLPKLLRVSQISESDCEVIKFFGSELKDWELRDEPAKSVNFNYRLERRLSQWILIYHSSLDYGCVREILESFASSSYWLTIDFALCTMQLILLYVHNNDMAIVADGFTRMQRWVKSLEQTEEFFDTFSSEDPFKTSYNPLAQTATVDARFFSHSNQRLAFLDEWIGAAEVRRCALGVLAARQAWPGFPHQVLASLRPAAARPEVEIIDLVDRTLREICYVYPRLVERAFAQWGVSSQRAQSIRFRTDVRDPTGVEFSADALYKDLFLSTPERRLKVAAWYEQLHHERTLRDFCAKIWDFLLTEISLPETTKAIKDGTELPSPLQQE